MLYGPLLRACLRFLREKKADAPWFKGREPFFEENLEKVFYGLGVLTKAVFIGYIYNSFFKRNNPMETWNFGTPSWYADGPLERPRHMSMPVFTPPLPNEHYKDYCEFTKYMGVDFRVKSNLGWQRIRSASTIPIYYETDNILVDALIDERHTRRVQQAIMNSAQLGASVLGTITQDELRENWLRNLNKQVDLDLPQNIAGVSISREN